MKNILVYLLLVGSATFWGANFNVGKLAIGIITPMSVIAWRFIIASLLMLIILFMKERPTWKAIRPNIWMYVLLGIIGIFGFNGLVFVGLSRTSPVNASLIMATNPIVTVILSAIFLRERMQARQAIGMLVSFTGVMLVLTNGSLGRLGTVSVGDLLVLAGNICWALYSVLSRRYVKNSSPLTTSAITMLVGAVCLAPFANTYHAATTPSMVAAAWFSIIFMALCGSVLAYLWWNLGIAQIGANRTSIFFNLVPVMTMVFASFSGETIMATQLMGTFLVIAGVILTTFKRQKYPQVNPVFKHQES